MKLTLSGTFLTPMETPLCVKLRTQQGGISMLQYRGNYLVRSTGLYILKYFQTEGEVRGLYWLNQLILTLAVSSEGL